MRLIDADAAIDGIAKAAREKFSLSDEFGYYLEGLGDADEVVRALPTAQPKKGKWEERAIENVKDSGIEEVQVAKCSACGLYHTTPYMYYFSDYNYCPNCGARMVDEDERPN